MSGSRASQRKSVTIGVGVARNLEALLVEASEQRRLSGRQRARFKRYARALKTRLNGTSRNQIRVSGRWCLVMLRCLACLLEHSQELRRVVERMVGKA